MATTKNIDFNAAIHQLAEDNNVDFDDIMAIAKNAILTAYKKVVEIDREEELEGYDVDFDEETGLPIILSTKEVVSFVNDQETQILESQAKLIDSNLKVGDSIQIDVTPESFGRIAAQAAKQRIIQGIRDSIRDSMIAKYSDKVGKIVSGVILRKDLHYVRVEVDRAEAVLPNSEQVPGEEYRSSSRKRFLLVSLNRSQTDNRMLLSRASTDFLKALFEMEVPEVSNGNVEVVNIVREPGSRSKIAVTSNHEKVDAIGSCVGPKGTRIESIMNEVQPEKVDIISWDEDIKAYIINSLSPAKVMDIKTIKKDSYAKVLVNEETLSLAIGKDGQNVRLAAKLTGYKIDITADKELFKKKGMITPVKEEDED